ncbi:MAG: hypothetical protein ACR2J8_11585 [Thermomicrobiales bacterium]
MGSSFTRRSLLTASLGGALSLGAAARASAGPAPIVLPDGRVYEAYIPAATKAGQFFHYTCEFDAAWAVLATFGFDVPLDVQLAMVGQDLSVEPVYDETASGVIIYGGEIGEHYSGDYQSNFLARATGRAMAPVFRKHGLSADPVSDRPAIEDALRRGALVWAKITVDFKDWMPATWVTPSGLTYPTVLGNDHAAIVIGYNVDGVVMRDVLGPTDTNWDRPYEYDVPWDRFLQVLAAQNGDGLAVGPLPRSDT